MIAARTAALLGLAALAAAGGCISTHQCAGRVREDLRADAIRAALDRKMVDVDLIPRDDEALALGAGTPWAEMTEERRAAVSGPAAGYAACVREASNRR